MSQHNFTSGRVFLNTRPDETVDKTVDVFFAHVRAWSCLFQLAINLSCVRLPVGKYKQIVTVVNAYIDQNITRERLQASSLID